MISTPDRQLAVSLIDEARIAGTRLKPSCAMLGITARTWQRWTQGSAVCADGRPAAVRPVPSHALTEGERQAVLEITPQQARGPPCSRITPLCHQARSFRSWPIRESTCLPQAGLLN